MIQQIYEDDKYVIVKYFYPKKFMDEFITSEIAEDDEYVYIPSIDWGLQQITSIAYSKPILNYIIPDNGNVIIDNIQKYIKRQKNWKKYTKIKQVEISTFCDNKLKVLLNQDLIATDMETSLSFKIFKDFETLKKDVIENICEIIILGKV